MLPKIDLPTYELTLPSTGKKVKVRPFLVKEEKLLLMALESDDDLEIVNTTKQIINNCIVSEKIDVNALPFFDIDYLFIALRAKSIGEKVDIKYTCKNVVNGEACGASFDAEMDVSNVKVIKDESIADIIDLKNNIKVKMKYPSYTTMKLIMDNDNILDKKIKLIANSIEYIQNKESIITTKDVTKEELEQFVGDLIQEQYKKLEHFIDNLPSFVVQSTATCKKCNFVHNLEYSDFTSFFV